MSRVQRLMLVTTSVIVCMIFGLWTQVHAAGYWYCDYIFVCTSWEGGYCFDGEWDQLCDWYDSGPSDPGPSDGSGGVSNPVTLEITNASITDNTISIQFGPTSMSGQLFVSANKSDSDWTEIYNATVTGSQSPLTISFHNDTLPAGSYNTVEATWYPVGSLTMHSAYAVKFMVLGNYLHSQYNTPYEGTCNQAHYDHTIAPTDACTSAANVSLRYDFSGKVNMQGTGVSESWAGLIHTSINTNCHNADFYQIPYVAGKWGPVDDTTVAYNSNANADIQPNDSIFLAGYNGIKTKSVTDRCPWCAAAQFDNYTSDARCYGIVNLGNFQTIRLR